MERNTEIVCYLHWCLFCSPVILKSGVVSYKPLGDFSYVIMIDVPLMFTFILVRVKELYCSM